MWIDGEGEEEVNDDVDGEENTDTGENAGDEGGDEDGTAEKEADAASDGDEGDDKSDKGEDDKSEDGKSEDELEGAPEAYDDFKLPEGMQFEGEQLEAFTEFGQKYGLSQDAAQNLIDMHLGQVDKITTLQQETWDEIKADWRKQSLADKDLQDEEGNAEAAIAIAVKGVEALGGKALKEAFDLTGAGEHPAVVKAFHKLGKMAVEDEFVFGGGSGDQKTPAEKLYPTMNK
jgi:hypothetical protein